MWIFITDISMDRIINKCHLLRFISCSFGTCVDLNLGSPRLCGLLWCDAVYLGTYFSKFSWRTAAECFQNADIRLKTTRCHTHQGHNMEIHSVVYDSLMSGIPTNYLKSEIRVWLGKHKPENDVKAVRSKGCQTLLCASYVIILDNHLLQTRDLVNYRRTE